MEHTQIEENNLIDRYVRGTLPVELRADFEEHFLDCPDCLEQIRLASALRDGLRLSAAEQAAAAPARAQVAKRFWWRWAPVVGIAGLAVAITPAVVLFRELGSAQDELSRERVALGAAAKLLDGVQRAGVAVYVLNPVRGEAAAARIVVAASAPWTVLTLQSDFTRFTEYRATLRNERGQVVWRQDHLRPASPDAVGLFLSSALLIPGGYTLALEGRDAQSAYEAAGTFSFSVSR